MTITKFNYELFKTFLFGLIIILMPILVSAQSVGINTDSITPSAVLQIDSDSLGILIPRLDSSAISGIADPAISLLVYQNNGNEGYKYYDGERWRTLAENTIEYQFINPDSIGQEEVDSFIYSQNLEGNHFFHYDSLGTNRGVWFWNGDELLSFDSSFGQGLKIYLSYSELREDSSEYYPSTVLVDDFSVSYEDQEYKVIGGLFKKVNIGSENGGETIVNDQGVIYKRVWDKVNVYTNWWEIGGYNHLGTKYLDDFSLSGIQNTGDRVISACGFAENGNIIHLSGKDIYEVNRKINLKNYCTLEGNGAIIIRAPVITSLTAASGQGSNTYEVADASLFRKGMSINAFGSVAYGDQSQSTPSWSMVVSNIEGNTITLTTGVGQGIPSGSLVSITDELIRSGPQKVKVSNIILDGNADVVNSTYSWTHLQGVVAFNLATNIRDQGVVFEDVVFQNIGSEAYVGPAPTWFSRCEFIDIKGACVHGSEGDSGYDVHGMFIENCKFLNIGHATDAENGHGQVGIYVQSIGSKNVVIDGCYAEGGPTGGIVTHLTGTTDYIKISNSVFKNFDHISTNTSTSGITGFDIHNNTFENCGTMNFQATVNNNNIYRRINISNNQFLNCRFTLMGVNEATISNNIIRYEPNSLFIDFPTSKRTFGNGSFGLFAVSAANSTINNNIITSTEYESSIRVGLWTNTRTSTSLQNMKIWGNTITGFNRPLFQTFGGTNTYRTNIEISNNIVEVEDYGIGGSVGIQAGHGAVVKENKVTNINNTPSLRIYGTNTNAPANNKISAWVLNNICEGSTYSKMIDIIYRNVYLNGNNITGDIGFQNATYKTYNILGKNYKVDVLNRTVEEID